jgi:hypothetical protein
MNLPNNTKNIANERFGRLVAMQPTSERKNSSIVWICICDCGNTCKKSVKNLRHTKSCGCLEKENREYWHNIAPMKKEAGIANFNILFSSYKNSAKKRGLEFSLSENEFRDITSRDCSYCGRKPEQYFKGNFKNGFYFHNGIDRRNNARGYTLENTVSCCKRCNYGKHTMGEKEFLEWINQVYEFRIKASP